MQADVWVSRSRQRDAICLSSPGGGIDIAVQTPHDGLIAGDSIYFTTVDGRIVIVNRYTGKFDRIMDLNVTERGKTSAVGLVSRIVAG